MKPQPDLGEMGESQLRHWCAEVGITVNRAERDRTGWDYLLEFPASKSTLESQPLDKQPAPVQSMIQVKTTQLKRNAISVKLSNWTRLVNTPLPAFFLVLRYTRKPACFEGFLVHVDKTQIGRVLKRLRGLSHEGSAGATLHRRSLALRWSNEVRLGSLSGKALADVILKAVGPDPLAYVERKHRLLRDVGYEDARAELDARVIVPEEYRSERLGELLIDFSIGVISTLEVASADIWDVRFGIRAPKAEHHFEEGGKLGVARQPTRQGLLLLRSSEQAREVRIPAAAFAPSGIGPALMQSNFKVRLTMPNASLVIALSTGRSQFSIRVPRTDEPHVIEDLYHTAMLLLFAGDASEQAWAPVEMQFCDQPLGRLSITDLKPLPQVREWANLMIKTRDMMVAVGIPSTSAVIPDRLWPQRMEIALLQALLVGHPENAVLRFSLGQPTDLSAKKCCMPQLITAEVGDYRVFIIAVFTGRATPVQGPSHQYSVPIESTVISRRQVLHVDEPFPAPAAQMLQEAVQPFQGDYNVIKWWSE